jgi:hypothetical protein
MKRVYSQAFATNSAEHRLSPVSISIRLIPIFRSSDMASFASAFSVSQSGYARHRPHR